jgi:hypothetical protein
MATCLVQANPSLNNMQIAEAIRQSASQYNSPDEMLGYGIPDFILANNILTIINSHEGNGFLVSVFPNPVSDEFTIEAGMHGGMEAWNEDLTIEISDITGRLVGTQKENQADSGKIRVNLLRNAPGGLYFIKLKSGDFCLTLKIVKD